MAEENNARNRARLEKQLEQALELESKRIPDKTYKNEYKRYVSWVKNQPHLDTQQKPFITQENVEEYFHKEVVNCRLGRTNNRRVGSALDWYYTQERSSRIQLALNGDDVPAITGKINDLPEVKIALERQKAILEAKQSSNTDPHKGLKDIISFKDNKEAIKHAYEQPEWTSLAIHYLYGQNGAIRGASNQNLKYADLKLSDTFVFEQEKPGHKCLLVIIQKGSMHKDQHEQDK